MTEPQRLEILLVATPGLEQALCDEAREKGFPQLRLIPGGVLTSGHWRDVWRANLELRGASRVLARIGSFRALHLAQLDKRARKFPWAEVLRKDVPVRVEASCSKSRIYHAGAAAQRIARAIAEELGAPVTEDAELAVKARIEDDLCTLSIDTSGEMLHKRGHKEAVGKAPMRETMAALFLRACGYDGTEPVVDPMCGSGTFIIEAAEIAAGLQPGRSRRFAFEQLASFDARRWQKLRDRGEIAVPASRYYGSDRDAGAIAMSLANAARAEVDRYTEFRQHAVSDLARPEGPPGLVIANPPYGGRIGDKHELVALYGALGKTLRERFGGWRVGIVTDEARLARATDLTFLPAAKPILHGGIKVMLYRTDPLP